MNKLLKEKAMTFLEMTISVAIFSIIVASIFTAVYTGRLYWKVGTSQLDAQQQARLAISFIAKELRQGRATPGQVDGVTVDVLENLPADDAWHSYRDSALFRANPLRFRIPQDTDANGIVLNASGAVVDWSEEITYCLDITNNQIIRLWQITSPCSCQAPYTNCRVLANYAYNLEFKRESDHPKIIQVRLTTRKNIEGTTEPVEYVITSWIRLRN